MQELIHVFADLMNIAKRFVRRARRPTHGIDQGCQPVGLADDHSGVFAQTGVGKLALQQLRGATQTAQRIFDFMRELPDHHSAADEPLTQIAFTRQPRALGRIREFQQQVCARHLPFKRRNRNIQHARLALRATGLDSQLAFRKSVALIARALERCDQAVLVS